MPGTKMLQISPQRSSLAIEDDDFRRLAVGDVVVQQHAHGRGRTAEHDELHAVVVQNCPVWQRMIELESADADAA